MDEDIKKIRAYIWRFFSRMIGIFVLLWLICYWFSESTKTPITQVRPPEEVWKGYDPSRPVTDIAEIDYENMRLTYRTYLKPGEQPPPLKIYDNQRHSQGVTITTGGGKTINTELTYEELFEQLNLEYEDLYEYYMD